MKFIDLNLNVNLKTANKKFIDDLTKTERDKMEFNSVNRKLLSFCSLSIIVQSFVVCIVLWRHFINARNKWCVLYTSHSM